MGVWVVLSFSVKLPVFGLHFWLPIAHVEAPTFGSIILAGLLLKMGGCGLIRCLPLLEGGVLETLREWFRVYLLAALVFSSLLCLAQRDFKRLVAYSSVVHITVVLSLLCTPSPLSIRVILVLLVTHGLSSPLLFFIVGMVYSIFSTRELPFIRGLLKFLIGFMFFVLF